MGLYRAVKNLLDKFRAERKGGGGAPVLPRPTFPRFPEPKIGQTELEITERPLLEVIKPDFEKAVTQATSNLVSQGVVEDIENFLYFGTWLSVVSSNVARMRYEPAETSGAAFPPPSGTVPAGAIGGRSSGGRLIVQFIQHGSTYEYSGVTVEVAHDFAMASSKGRWVWDHLRSAGLNYAFIGSDDGHVPQRLNPGSRRSQKRLAKTLRRRARKAATQPRFAKVKVRKSLSEIVRRINKERAPARKSAAVDTIFGAR